LRESAQVVAEYSPWTFIPKQVFNFSDGTSMLLEPFVMIRTAGGSPNVFDAVLGNKLFDHTHFFPLLFGPFTCSFAGYGWI
jgi:hypothetical protein